MNGCPFIIGIQYILQSLVHGDPFLGNIFLVDSLTIFLTSFIQRLLICFKKHFPFSQFSIYILNEFSQTSKLSLSSESVRKYLYNPKDVQAGARVLF